MYARQILWPTKWSFLVRRFPTNLYLTAEAAGGEKVSKILKAIITLIILFFTHNAYP